MFGIFTDNWVYFSEGFALPVAYFGYKIVENRSVTLEGVARRAKYWAVNAALPYWARRGQKPNGSFCEELYHNGPANWMTTRRLRVQARQIYVFAHADKLGWYDGRDIVRTGLTFLNSHGQRQNGPGYAHLIRLDDTVVDDRFDLYDHAFYLLAHAWASYVIGDAPLHAARQLLHTIDRLLAAPTGGWYEGLPLDDPRSALRRQNPHMHMLEALMALYDASGDPEYLDRAGEMIDLFGTHFYDAQSRTITEYFHSDWQAVKFGKGESREPGHAAEWVWLLWQFEQRSGISTAEYAWPLYENLVEHNAGFLLDEELPSGETIRGTKRLWVQTELIKAHLAQAQRGAPGARSMAAAAIEGLMKHYLKNDGTWHDQLGPQRLPMLGPVPASTFYHIFCMIAEACAMVDT